MIPLANVDDLMLREDVLEAVTNGRFHIWPIARVEQGVELLTGNPAGSRNGSGKFEPGTVFARVDERLRDMARVMKEFES
jgi:predicted ATP-dependent protease